MMDVIYLRTLIVLYPIGRMVLQGVNATPNPQLFAA